MKQMKVLLVMSCLLSQVGISAPFVEREGAYEINWTNSKVRFYGVSKYNETDANYRAVGQRAWAKGLKLAEHNIPILLSDKLGAVKGVEQAKLSQLAEMTLSVTSTYFGDDRVKVLLETPIQKMTPQLVHTAQTPVNITGGESSEIVIQLPKGAKPAAYTRIMDEHGRELVNAAELASAAHQGSAMVKWYKSEQDNAAANGATSIVIQGQSSERGTVRVQSADWKPNYAAAMLSGKAVFVVK